MGLKQFKGDLAAAKAVLIDNVSGICNGDSDGEVVFKYSFGEDAPIEVRALALDIDEYPRSSAFLVFTSSEGVGTDLELFIQGLSSLVEGKGVADLIQIVSKRLTARFEGNDNTSDQENDAQNEDDDEEYDEDALSEFTGSIDDAFTADLEDDFVVVDNSVRRKQTDTPIVYDQTTLRRLSRDLKAARDAGYRVSVLLNNPGQWIFSIAVRVSKLGIPEEALEAWGLKERDYIVLLVKLRGYPSTPEFINLSSDQTTVQFRFGKCVKAKPALASAREVFDSQELMTATEDTASAAPQKISPEDTFEFVHMSASLNTLLTQELPPLLNLRRQLNISWEEAHTIKFNRARTSHAVQEQVDRMREFDLVAETQPDPTTQIPGFLEHDYAMDESESLNLLVVATQLGLLRLIRCNQYCMVCHRKAKSAFEAVKPYVCEESLCLYQYLSLGFGQSIEHEIINNPYVIDLLICFFHSAAHDNGFREVPRGLRLMYPYVGDKDELTRYHEAEANFEAKTVRFPVGDDYSYVSMKEGDIILMVVDQGFSNRTYSISSGNCERYQCIVDSIRGDTFTYRIMATFTAPHNVQGYVKDSEQPWKKYSGWEKVLIFRTLKDIDDLDPKTLSIALSHITHTIPKVTDMRTWLIEHPGRRLSSWKGIYPSSLCLLNWIVASNRSHLVHEGLLGKQPFPETSYEEKRVEEGPEAAGPGQSYWMQFRFVQGSPEKDLMFKQELETMNANHGGQHPHPTIFAWHGSPLKNWHSIVRVGLDFQEKQHGRSYGNGVYFSSNLGTSLAYCGSLLPFRYDLGWQNSILRVKSAISICEIVNQPASFVSQAPHYVVDKVSWIQCRYLYAEVHPTADLDLASKPTPPGAKNFIAQDPVRVLNGNANKVVQIPISALPITRRRQLMASLPKDEKSEPGASTDNPIVIDDTNESDVDADELDLFGSEDEDDYFRRPSTDRKRPHSPDSLTPNDRPVKLTTGAQEAAFDRLCIDGSPFDPKTTDFRPGTLDLASLPRMREPSWASSSPAALRRLSRELKDLQKTQSSHNLRDLGWYIDFDKVDNLFQWIVELHSFDESLPLAQDMKRLNCQSIALEIRFGASFPMAPPFVRVIRPKFIPFAAGGGGHVLAGGAMCTELLTNSGWSPALSMEKVFLEVRMNISDTNPPARLQQGREGGTDDYFIHDAVNSFRNAVMAHGWQMPPDLNDLVSFQTLELPN